MTRGAPAGGPARDASGLLTASAPIPPALDALALWRALPSARRFLWEHPEAGVAVAGVGEAMTVRAHGAPRIAEVATALGALPPGAVLVGGFAFDGASPADATWSRFGAATWVVPALALVRRDGAARLVATTAGDPSPDALLAAALAALDVPCPPPPPPPSRFQLSALRPAAHWRAAVDATLADIAAGRLVKLVLARAARVRADAAFDARRVLARLRRAYPGCAVFAVGVGGATFVGASPERLARVAGDRLATAALAGTAPRGASGDQDAALAAALLASPKERAEHACVAEDLAARLAPLCRALEAAPAPAVLRTETVQHLHTPVAGRLREGVGLLEVVAALHPTPAICGAPREAALAVLRAREELARGWYGGGVGWLDGDGGEVSVAIRTALLDGRHALLHAGAGIVAGSDWERELEETRLKLRPLVSALVEL